MNSKVISKETQEEIEYPMLGIDNDDGMVILFSAESEGVVIASGTSSVLVGCRDDDWAMELFTPFSGTVELSN